MTERKRGPLGTEIGDEEQCLPECDSHTFPFAFPRLEQARLFIIIDDGFYAEVGIYVLGLLMISCHTLDLWGSSMCVWAHLCVSGTTLCWRRVAAVCLYYEYPRTVSLREDRLLARGHIVSVQVTKLQSFNYCLC